MIRNWPVFTFLLNVTTHDSALKLQKKLGGNSQIIQYEGVHLTGYLVDHDNKGFGGWFVNQIDRFIVNDASLNSVNNITVKIMKMKRRKENF